MTTTSTFNQYNYPVQFTFRIGTLHNDFVATDANGEVLAYVKQKLFKLKEHVNVFADTSQAELKYEIHADKWLDFNTCYTFFDATNHELGRVVRKGWKSIWKATYEIFDEQQQPDIVITEANPFAKVLDAFLGEVPILGFFTGLLFNPTYHLKRPDGTLVFECKKEASLFGRKFKLSNVSLMEPGEEERVLLGLMMMLLLERRRG